MYLCPIPSCPLWIKYNYIAVCLLLLLIVIIYFRQLHRIQELQHIMTDMGSIDHVLPLLARSNDEIVKETLAYMSTLLFNACKHVQVGLHNQKQYTFFKLEFIGLRWLNWHDFQLWTIWTCFLWPWNRYPYRFIYF